MTKASDLTAL